MKSKKAWYVILTVGLSLLCVFFAYNYFYFISKSEVRNLTTFFEISSKIMESKLGANRQTVRIMSKVINMNGNNPKDVQLFLC